MSGTMVEISTEDGVADAYLARPEDGGRHPAVLLFVDAFGLRPQIERMADRIAAAGYVVLVPNIFYRAGRAPVVELPDLRDPEQRGPLIERLRPLMAALTPQVTIRDASAYLDRLGQESDGPVTVVGYCMGGRLGWHVAAAEPERVAALAGFHAGGLVTDSPDSPHLSTDRLHAELLLAHADHDPSMTAEGIATLERSLDAAGVRYRSEVYSGAGHGYTMADTAAYDEDAAERHFAELFGLLERVTAA